MARRWPAATRAARASETERGREEAADEWARARFFFLFSFFFQGCDTARPEAHAPDLHQPVCYLVCNPTTARWPSVPASGSPASAVLPLSSLEATN